MRTSGINTVDTTQQRLWRRESGYITVSHVTQKYMLIYTVSQQSDATSPRERGCNLVLLEMIFFRRHLKESHGSLQLDVTGAHHPEPHLPVYPRVNLCAYLYIFRTIILAQSFCPLVIRTSSGFPLICLFHVETSLVTAQRHQYHGLADLKIRGLAQANS